MTNSIRSSLIGNRQIHAWIVHRLCDLHTWLSLAQFQVEDWLSEIDPTTPVPARGYRAFGKMYWHDGKEVQEQTLKLRVIEASEVRHKQRRAQNSS